ncbi:hypothetical protein LMORI2_05490 [Limnohabitans sp. MORI2]|nr:hypothetical protein LMORI2_05490 [Limnohabitans sp. MORI2]
MTSTQTDSPSVSLAMQAWLVLACGIAYFYAFQLNSYWFNHWLEFSPGANWIFIPSGLRLLFVLVLATTGAAGIAISSVAINYSFGDPNAHVFNVVTGLISGAAPCLARYLCITSLHLDTQLSNLTSRTFLKVSVLFALVNALMHQTWYHWIGHTHTFVSSTAVMALGDWLGTVLVLATASLFVRLYKLLSVSADKP